MLHISFIKVKTSEDMGKAAADEIEAIIQAKPSCVIGLAAGSTPIPLYRELILRERAGCIDFSQVRSVNLDEYKGISPDHPQSYHYFMKVNLFDHISIKEDNAMIPNGLAENIPAMCQEYELEIEKWGGVDIQLLGLGHNGHIGFNEPCDHFPAVTHEVRLSEMTREANKRFLLRSTMSLHPPLRWASARLWHRRKLSCLLRARTRQISSSALFGDL